MIKYDKKSMSLREEKKEEEVHIRKKTKHKLLPLLIQKCVVFLESVIGVLLTGRRSKKDVSLCHPGTSAADLSLLFMLK